MILIILVISLNTEPPSHQQEHSGIPTLDATLRNEGEKKKAMNSDGRLANWVSRLL